MTKEQVYEIKNKVRCPQLGSIDYGEWGILNFEQRKAINILCDSWLVINAHDTFQTMYTEEFVKFVKDLIKDMEATPADGLNQEIEKNSCLAVADAILNKFINLKEGKE